ncbi:hypothetical protein ACIBL8_26605 [Streptomyces sp. NPDC050523]|uniref:hypothetical protein n=1 Tax=Streptomyces sp. NPDC050523 TaxID=3365622 RepID=UPI003787DC39
MNDDFVVLTHDGDVICPSDPTFGYSVCDDCKGTGTVIDDDGSVSGKPGLVIPCVCSEASEIVYPVEIGPEDEPVPGYSAQHSTASAPVLRVVA